MEKHLEECQKAEDEEPDVLDIVRNKEAGHRQTSPASAPVPAQRTRRTPPPPPPPAAATSSHTPPPFTPSSPPPAYEKCDLCSQVFHHQPAEGDRQALSPQQLLRCHLIAVHKIAGGALEKCVKCPSFSALNKAHLQIHLERGYRHQKKMEEKCNQCQYKSKDENLMKRHVGLKHKINITCKYWKSGSCKETFCQFMHQVVDSGRGQVGAGQARPGGGQGPSHPRPPAWVNPVYQGQEDAATAFPFLGQKGQCQAQCCARSMGR